jgi:hypothetical protein
VSVDISELVQLAHSMAELQRQVDLIRDKVEDLLQPAIEAWEEVEPPPCGFTGGWTFEHLDQEGEYVVLKHDCFNLHRYDLRNEYSTRVKLHDLLAKLPEPPAPQSKAELVTVTTDVIAELGEALRVWNRVGDADMVVSAAQKLYEQVTT